MPLTFPSHAAAVLPLKLWRRRWFDGVALVIGSAAPDLPYSLDPYVYLRAHTWWGIAWFCVPVTVLLTALTRRSAPLVVARLPWRRWPALGDYAALGAHRYRWWTTVVSAWLGACSHRLWDLVTHPSMDGGAISIGWLSTEAFAGQPWWRVLHYGSTVAGALVVLAVAVHVGRTGWLRTAASGKSGCGAGGGYGAGNSGCGGGSSGGDNDRAPAGPAEPVAGRAAERPVVFWSAVAAVWVPGTLVQPFLAGFTQPSSMVVRLLEVGGLGLLAGAAATAIMRDWGSSPPERGG